MAITSHPRYKLVQQYWASEAKTSWPNKEKLTSNQARREYAKQEKLLAEYGECLPAVPISRCPFCQTVLEYVFDPMGFDGMWWAKDDIVPTQPPDEPHYRVLQGAVDFHGREPDEAEPNGCVLPGPSVPFVIPRLLQLPGMIAVVSNLTLPHEDAAYLIAYFSEKEIDPYELHECWGRESFGIQDEDGEDVTWGAANDLWDFELQPWIDQGRLKWIEPGDPKLVIKDSGKCPYIGLPGIREPQVIEVGKLGTLPPPDGEPIDPFE